MQVNNECKVTYQVFPARVVARDEASALVHEFDRKIVVEACLLEPAAASDFLYQPEDAVRLVNKARIGEATSGAKGSSAEKHRLDEDLRLDYL